MWCSNPPELLGEAEDLHGGAEDHHSRAGMTEDPHGGADDHHSKYTEERTTMLDLVELETTTWVHVGFQR